MEIETHNSLKYIKYTNNSVVLDMDEQSNDSTTDAQHVRVTWHGVHMIAIPGNKGEQEYYR
jgi:hypothetical protein